MSITARCGDCAKAYKVDEKFAGKKLKCKVCGGVIAVPKVVSAVPLDAPTRVISRSAPARPASRPAPPPVDDDPFSQLDALAALDNPSADQDVPVAPAYSPRGQFSRGGRAAPEPSYEADDKLAPPVRRAAMVTRKGGPVVAAGARVEYETVRVRGNRHISIPGEETMDRMLPIIFIGGLVVLLLLRFVWEIQQGMELTKLSMFKYNWSGRLTFQSLIIASWLVVVYGVASPLAALGVNIASKISNYQPPKNLYRRCATAMSFGPFVAMALYNLAFLTKTAELIRNLDAFTYVALLLSFGILWLMIRLDGGAYFVTAALVLLSMLATAMVLLVVKLSMKLTFLDMLVGERIFGRY